MMTMIVPGVSVAEVELDGEDEVAETGAGVVTVTGEAVDAERRAATTTRLTKNHLLETFTNVRVRSI
jgi:hypothetical protein